MRNTHVPPGFWRAVAHTNNPIFRECFIDELAHAAGKEPSIFRRPYLEKKPKDLGVLDAVAKAIGWGTPAPKACFAASPWRIHMEASPPPQSSSPCKRRCA